MSIDVESQTNRLPNNGVPAEKPDAAKTLPAEQGSLRSAVSFAQKAFELVSGICEFDCRLCGYYCVATWFMQQINPFPSLTLMGPPGTGKTCALRAFKEMAFKPVMFTAKKITEPVARDYLRDAHCGTAIIDEADEPLFDLEGLLTNRYLKETAFSAKKIPTGDGDWMTENIPIWGATVLHKREPFKDHAVASRGMTINVVPNISRTYSDPYKLAPLYLKVRSLSELASKAITLTKAPVKPEGYEVAGRVTDTYRPILLIAQRLDDKPFLDTLWDKIVDASLELKEGQTYEPGPLLLQALIAQLEVDGKLKLHSVPIEGELLKWVREKHGKVINAWQAAKILRDYGLTVKRIGGPNHVLVEDIRVLAQVCRKVSIKDEVLEAEVRSLQ